MLLEFSSESQTGQPEDFLQVYLTQGTGGEVRPVYTGLIRFERVKYTIYFDFRYEIRQR